MTAEEVVLVELARRKGNRGADVLNAVFDDFGFGWRTDHAHRAGIAAQCRALEETGNFADDLATIATGVFERFRHPHDPGEVRAAVARHLSDGHGTLPPDPRR